ncbi:peptidase S8/S53 domain-containing protein [Endogone sp. FLAS-F59071]|nr:peptidase S8/S53 domain-containing protein [Endogone sp. FLAS-F59071]|eukprot:RUS17373.1 peptidase S8/S53 domain-containing protein [Endogone sp. FLAS-F59071]
MLIKKAIILAAVYFCTVTAVPVLQTSDYSEGLAPLLSSIDAEVIADSYIIVLKKDLPADRLDSHRKWIRAVHEDSIPLKDLVDSDIAAGIKHTYDTPNLKGYSGKFSEHVLERIRASEEVAYVERDSIVYASELQRNAPWGLSRLSHREPLTLRTYNKYQYEDSAGEGVKVYVIDTGVNIEHNDFEGRATWGQTIPDGDEDIDGNGHGSHVAGTIAGKKYGVAKKANIIAVKVLRSNGSGTMSDVLAGVEWAIDAHNNDVALAAQQGRKQINSVANMSLGGGKSQALDDVVNDAVDAGIIFAVAAGNDNRDACDYSPAASEKAITVGASTIQDERAYFSNYGKCVDVFGPGMDIQSIWIGSKFATNTISGTSMASPHVAGLAAYYVSLAPENVTITPKYIKDRIIELSTKDILEKIPKGTVNRLVFNDFQESFYRELGIDQ